jgi:serine/threonine-protein kinase
VGLDTQLVVAALPQYEIGAELGRGGNGIVLEGRHRQLGRRVAIKQLPRAFGADEGVRARFAAEARLVATLDHPHIVPVYDFVEKDGLCLIVMEYLAGGSVWDQFRDHGLPPNQAIAYALAASVAAHAAHEKGVLHRDIKPENLLLNDNRVPKLTDFGLAKMLDGSSLAQKTAAGVVPGTPAFIAPEQVLGRPLGPPTDVYALATMTYELLSGRLPFPEVESPVAQLLQHVEQEPTPLGEVLPAEVPRSVVPVVMRGLAKTTEERWPTASAYAVALAQAMTAEAGATWLDESGVPLHAAGDVMIAARTPVAPAAQAPRDLTMTIRAERSHLVVPLPGVEEMAAPVSPPTPTAAPTGVPPVAAVVPAAQPPAPPAPSPPVAATSTPPPVAASPPPIPTPEPTGPPSDPRLGPWTRPTLETRPKTPSNPLVIVLAIVAALVLVALVIAIVSG